MVRRLPLRAKKLLGGSLQKLPSASHTTSTEYLKGAKPADLPVEQPTKFEFMTISRPPRRQIGRGDAPDVLARETRR